MKKNIKHIILLLAFVGSFINYSYAQTTVKLKINHLLESEDFDLRKETKNDLGNEFMTLRLEYYISGIKLIHDNGQETELSSRYILQNATDDDTVTLGNVNITNLESISFCIGVEKAVNHGDPSKWSSSHALSPKSPSMHWGWTSGYRFVAFEGATGPNLTKKFAIHALGDKNYFRMNIPTTGQVINNNLVVLLNADYTKAISQINLSTGIFNHGEDDEAAELLRNFQTKVFTNMSGEGNTLAVKDLNVGNAFILAPNPSMGSFKINVTDNRFTQSQIIIRDLSGRTILESEMTTEIRGLSAGMYTITLKNNNSISTQKLIVK
jgi:hypothetical protein